MKIVNRIAWGVFGLLAGFTIGMRICSGIMQAFDKFVGVYAAWGVSVVCAVIAVAFAPKVLENVKKHALTNKYAVIILAAFICGLCTLWPYVWVGFQMKGYPVMLSDLMNWILALGTGLILWLSSLYFIKAVITVFSWSKIKSKLRKITKYDIIFAAVLLIVLNVLMAMFCLNNKTICFWDNAGFWLTARNMAADYNNLGAAAVAKSIFSSVFTTDYNFIIAIPQMLLVLLFGEARMVYIMGITNIYMYPLLMLIYIFARSKVKRPIISAACTILSLPMIFYITKEGYIDVGAIIFAMAAVILWVRKQEDKSVERYIIIGTLLVISMLLRRWLVFFVVSYLAALALDCIVYKKSAVPLISAVMAIGVSLVSLFQPYITLKLMANYKDMYAAYSQGIHQDFINAAYYFGLLLMSIVIISAVVFILNKKTRRSAIFMTTQLAVCFVVFVNIQTHGEQHLLLYIPSVSCLLCMMFGKLWENKNIVPAVAVSGACVVTSLYGCTAGAKNLDNEKFSFIPSFSCMPAVRYDSDRVIELVHWLDENVGEKDKTVAVLASSMVFNREVLYNAEASLNVPRISDADRDKYLLWLPQVDKRDGAPYQIFEADYVVVADPVQLHLGEENQRCVQIPVQSFIEGTDIANAYKKLDTEFDLGWDGSIHINIYEKQRPVSDEEQAEFKEKLQNASPGVFKE